MSDFRIGDRVRVNCPNDSQFHGELGVVVAGPSKRNYAVRIDGHERRMAFGASTLELVERGAMPDPVSHPAHYTTHPSGIECIQITEHMGFNIGNAVKYLWRCDLKHDAIEDLKKARWYIDREIAKREVNPTPHH